MMRQKIFVKNFVLLLSLIALTACQRAKEDNSQVQFAVPLMNTITKASGLTNSPSNKVSTQSVGELNHVVINISGASLSGGTKLCSFDVYRESVAGPCDFSEFPVVKVTIPNGSARLIQVLLAYEDDSTGEMTMAYGDVTQDIQGDSGISIPVSDLPGSTYPSHIRGRYLTSATAGPTGLLEVRVKAKTDKPSMVITRSEMFSGWFQAFMVSGLQFEYYVNGSLLWGEAKETDDFIDDPSVIITSSYEVIGWFSTDNSLLADKTVDSCTTATEFVSCLEESSYFSGPFAKQSTGGLISFSGSGDQLNWSYLPGVSSVVDGVKIYYRNSMPDEEVLKRMSPDHGLLDCNLIASLADTTVWSSGILTSTTSFTSPLIPDPDSSFVAICPYKDANHYLSAITYPSLDEGDSGNETYFRVEISGASNGEDITYGTCYPVTVAAYIWDGTTASAYTNSSGSTWSLGLGTPTWADFYTDPGCTSSSPGTQNIDIVDGTSDSSATTLYIKANTTGTSLIFSMTGMPADVTYQPNYNIYNSY